MKKSDQQKRPAQVQTYVWHDDKLKNYQKPEKEKRLKRHSSLILRKFLDEEIERNELLIQKSNSFPIENREVLQNELTRRIDCFKQLECIVHEWTQLKTKPADYDNTQ